MTSLPSSATPSGSQSATIDLEAGTTVGDSASEKTVNGEGGEKDVDQGAEAGAEAGPHEKKPQETQVIPKNNLFLVFTG